MDLGVDLGELKGSAGAGGFCQRLGLVSERGHLVLDVLRERLLHEGRFGDGSDRFLAGRGGCALAVASLRLVAAARTPIPRRVALLFGHAANLGNNREKILELLGLRDDNRFRIRGRFESGGLVWSLVDQTPPLSAF